MELDEIDKLLAKVNGIVKDPPTKKNGKSPQPTGKQRAKRVQSQAGYQYEFNKSTGKLELRHRLLMEKSLGRPLHAYESVFFKDKDRTNFKLENLGLGLKPGFGIADIICPHCSNAFGSPNNNENNEDQ